ncbi:hypothetical protein LCGC14_1700680 [marine sediment metagenome]|uniref:Bacterial Ig-like domain-containing protein n=1 Tax=marine sediment metagenome TaxID=412755 RepID=A0A0F9HHU0_9ZZZZ
MKTIAFLAMAIVFWASSVLARPFLISDPQTGAEEYVVTIDGVESVSPAQDHGNGTVRLYHDLAGISDGLHNVEVKAQNVWGDSLPTPFVFTKTLPGGPTGIGLEK